MIEVTVDSIRVSLMSHHRVVILKALDREQYLPIWIGPSEADAITAELQGLEVSRPLTHDLLKSVIDSLGGEVTQVVVSDLRNETYYARIHVVQSGRELEIDSRPSDALALAVRVRVPVYVAESVMEQDGVVPETDEEPEDTDVPAEGTPAEETNDDSLSAFADFLDTLDLDDLDTSGDK